MSFSVNTPNKIIDQIARNLSFKSNNGKTESKFSFFYINDVHGQNMHGVKLAHDAFIKSTQNKPDLTTFSISAGDVIMGSPNLPVVKTRFWTKILNLILDISAIGNHELEISPDRFAEEVINSKFKYLAANIKSTPDTKLAKLLADKTISSSCILERNGEKVGFIGICPTDLHDLVCKESKIAEQVSVMTSKATLEAVQAEVNKLTGKTNKIVLLSHSRNIDDEAIANNVRGIDIICNGHPHNQCEKWITNKFGEPVKKVSTGRDATLTGTFNAVFDENGLLIPEKCQNIFNEVDLSRKDTMVQAIRNELEGVHAPVAHFETTLASPKNLYNEENMLSTLATDAIKYVTNAQIALINTDNSKGRIFKGYVNILDIEDAFPFRQKIYKFMLSEQDLVEALKNPPKRFLNSNKGPIALQGTGLKYKISQEGQLQEARVINADGTETVLNIDNPDKTKKFTVACDSFLIGEYDHVDGFRLDPGKLQQTVDQPEKDEGYFELCKAEAIEKYLKEQFPMGKTTYKAPGYTNLQLKK